MTESGIIRGQKEDYHPTESDLISGRNKGSNPTESGVIRGQKKDYHPTESDLFWGLNKDSYSIESDVETKNLIRSIRRSKQGFRPDWIWSNSRSQEGFKVGFGFNRTKRMDWKGLKVDSNSIELGARI